jgi:hypothetical protein
MPAITHEICGATAAAYGIADRCIEALLRLAEAAGYAVACRRGCGTCCDCFVMATFAEALPIALWLASPERKQRLDQFGEQMKRRRDALGPEAAVLEGFNAGTVRLPLRGPDPSRFEEAATAYRRRHLVAHSMRATAVAKSTR